jgi:peptide/nickel transport system permease protein
MIRYAARRLALAVPTLLGITLVTFAVIRLAPGDAAIAADRGGGLALSPETYARLSAAYGLDRPAWRQYAVWLWGMLRLDFGHSFHDGRAVADKIAERLPVTLLLTGGAVFLSLSLSIPIGMYSAARRGGVLDSLAGIVLYALYSVPRYVMAMLLICLVGVAWGWLPFYGSTSDGFEALSWLGKTSDLVRHFILIVLCFSYPLMAYQARFVRANLLEVMGQDFIRTARAKGLSEWTVMTRHAMPNTLIPLITMLGLLLPSLLGGSVILETMFGWPGLGQLMFAATLQRDYPTVMGLTVVTASLVLLGTLLVDLAYAAADPRVRYE